MHIIYTHYIYIYIYIYIHTLSRSAQPVMGHHGPSWGYFRLLAMIVGLLNTFFATLDDFQVRPVPLQRVWVSKGLTQADF